MRNLTLLLIYAAALTTGCGRQSEATPLPAAEAVAVAAAPAGKLGPPPKPVKDRPRAAEAAPAGKPDVVPAAFAQDEKPAPASLPQDKAAKLVAEFLQPKDAVLPLFLEKPRPLPGLMFLEKPAVPTTPFQGRPPRLVVKSKGKPILPHPVPEGMPLYSKRASPRLPVDIQLPAGTPVKWPGPNTDEPPSLPTLAQHQADRASLADPTSESSTAAALSATVPLRTSPAPFVRVNVPDPFEHREAVRLRMPPPEDATPRN